MPKNEWIEFLIDCLMNWLAALFVEKDLSATCDFLQYLPPRLDWVSQSFELQSLGRRKLIATADN